MTLGLLIAGLIVAITLYLFYCLFLRGGTWLVDSVLSEHVTPLDCITHGSGKN